MRSSKNVKGWTALAKPNVLSESLDPTTFRAQGEVIYQGSGITGLTAL